MGLTPKQKQVLDYIQAFSAQKGYAPSQQEIAKNFGFSSLGTVQNYLVRLERQGFLQKEWNARRGISSTHTTTPLHRASPPNVAPSRSPRSQIGPVAARSGSEGRGIISLPVLGRVAAGKPIEAIHADDPIEVPASMLKKSGEHFVLRVSGDSMIEDGILNGDLVVLRKQAEAAQGDTVVALVGNEATIKRFYRRKGNVELHPANPAYQPLIVPSLVDGGPEFRIEGVLVGVIRKL